MCNKSESIKNLALALVKAQSEMKAVNMNAENKFLGNKYADLGSVIETAKPVLAVNNLAVSQLATSEDGKIGITTLLMHSSGEWIESTLTMPLGEEKGRSMAQSAGAIITYLRRYAYASILGMYADEDTDGTAQKPKIPAPKEMSIEMAKNVKNSEGIKYGDIESNTLSNMSLGIAKALKKTDLTEEQRTEYALKRDAIATILKSRNGK